MQSSGRGKLLPRRRSNGSEKTGPTADRSRLISKYRELVAALKECSISRDLARGLELHSEAKSFALTSNSYVASSLIKMYANCERMADAREVFDKLVFRNAVVWTCLIAGYSENGENELALNLFDKMIESRCAPDARTFVAALSACAALAADAEELQKLRWLARGEALHSQAVNHRSCNKFVESRLIETYANCRSMVRAQQVFDSMLERDVVCWMALLVGYLENGENERALRVFDDLQQSGNCAPDSGIYVAALSACAGIAENQRDSDGNMEKCWRWLEKTKSLHAGALLSSCCDEFVECTLVSAYSKFGCMVLAQIVFDCMVSCDTATWIALVMGYIDNGENEVALELLALMQKHPCTPLAFAAGVMASGNLMAVEIGRRFHQEIQSAGLEQDVMLGNCLIDFYSKCGSMEEAEQVFNSIRRKNTISWTSLMCGFGLRGDAEKVFEVFERMREQGVVANEVTFVCLLSACSHAGLSDKGKALFREMEEVYGVKPSIKHYNCMVDLLGRANLVEEAMKMVRSMPFEPNVVTWTSLLGACEKWKNVEVGEVAYQELVNAGEKDGAASVLMASACRGNLSVSLQGKIVGSCKTRWVDEMGSVHTF